MLENTEGEIKLMENPEKKIATFGTQDSARSQKNTTMRKQT